MRRQPTPPLRGGEVQALPNIHTTLRHHPHPASRPMTLGHFTSWRADDRGYYTGVGYTPAELDHSFGAPMCPAWCNCDIQYMIQRDRKRDREQSERERERSWSHFWGNFLGRCGNTQRHLLHMKEPLGAILGRLGAILGRLGALLGWLGANLEPSWFVLGPLGPSWAVL